MIVVCTNLENQLDKLWYRLQNALHLSSGQGCSQLELDQACINWLERKIDMLETAVLQKSLEFGKKN